MRRTVDELITQMRLNASIPTAQNKYNNSRCLLFLNEELTMTIQPLLISLNSDYFVKSSDISLVNNTSEYDIPVQAVGWALYDWGYVDTTGEYRSLSQTAIPYLERTSEVDTYNYPSFLYIEDGKIKCRPKIGTAQGSLRLFWNRVQNELVQTSACGLISSVTDNTTVYSCVVDSVPIYSNGVDVISGTSPYDVIAENITVSSVSGTTLNLPVDDFDREPVAGDYICETGKTCIPNIPDIAMPALSQAATVRLLESMNDKSALEMANITLARMVKSVTDVCKTRVKARPKKLLPNNFLLNRYRR